MFLSFSDRPTGGPQAVSSPVTQRDVHADLFFDFCVFLTQSEKPSYKVSIFEEPGIEITRK